jgi:transposase
MAKRVIEIKTKKGVNYLYEDESYWDKNRGYSTHKRKCIGKVGADGQPIYNEYYKTRSKLNQLEKKQNRESESSTTTLIGETLIWDKIVKECKVRTALEEVFGKNESDKILSLAYYMVCQGKALSKAEPWLESRGLSHLDMSSQRISELLSRMSDDKANTFFNKWIDIQNSGKNMLFDITSISTYGKNNMYAEYGYNRDGEYLEQINLSFLTSCKSKLPIWYTVTPGSMSDKIVLDYVLEMLDKFNIKSFTFVGDRGFYSERNLQNICDKKHKFLVPVPSSIAWQKQMIAENRNSLVSPANVIKECGTIIYGKTIFKNTKYGRTWYHIYFDPSRKDKAIASFMLKLNQCKDELEANKPIEAHQSIYNQYFIIKDTPKRGRKVIYNDDAINTFINNDSCYWVLISTSAKIASEALMEYRERNDVELAFDDIKNLLDLKRLRNHNDLTVKGKIFINFISLILLSQLRKDVESIPEKERKYWSANEMLDRVETYSRVHFEGKSKDVFSVPTSSQRLIFDLLGISYQYKGEKRN